MTTKMGAVFFAAPILFGHTLLDWPLMALDAVERPQVAHMPLDGQMGQIWPTFEARPCRR
jgi:hypothetical protein